MSFKSFAAEKAPLVWAPPKKTRVIKNVATDLKPGDKIYYIWRGISGHSSEKVYGVFSHYETNDFDGLMVWARWPSNGGTLGWMPANNIFIE